MYVVEYLRSGRVEFAPFLHRPASSAAKLAGCIHVSGRRVAKSVLIRGGDAFVLAVLPATSWVDLDRLATALGSENVPLRLASADEIDRIFADCEPGAIPPFGRLYGLQTVVDTALAQAGEIVVRANTRHEGMKMRFEDYERLEAPVRADFGRPISPRSERPAVHRRRQAG